MSLRLLMGGGVANILDEKKLGYVSVEFGKNLFNAKDFSFYGNFILEGRRNEHYLGLGITLEKYFSDHFGLFLSTGVGRYSDKYYKLGSKTEFRSGLGMLYSFNPKVFLSVSFIHYSNGGLSQFNPGSESILLKVGYRF